MSRPLRVALLAHSTNPRGGVVHALELGDALNRLGHVATVLAPDVSGAGFFRRPACDTVAVQVAPERSPEPSDIFGMVEARVADYLRYFAAPERRGFDLFHAQDGISGNALATMKARGLIPGFARTVHHLDDFADERLQTLQHRSIVEADACLVVSPPWRDRLASEFGIAATVVGNGVDLRRFSRRPTPDDLILRHEIGLRGGPVFLAVGGVEARKNTRRILQAFAEVHRLLPEAQLVVAGGSSLLDHSAEKARFMRDLAALDLPDTTVIQLGPVADSAMPALYRNADALAFPSLAEGFGLVVLEAMASGLPVVTSRIPPFTSYLDQQDVVWCNPDSIASIADAMMIALAPEVRTELRRRGAAVAARHDWLDTARAHLPVYERLGAFEHA